jgi:hypothetical protein
MIRSLIPLAVVAVVAVGAAQSGEDVVREMHDRYVGQWYENLALIQTVTYSSAEGEGVDSVRVWYESIQLPGTVRSDIAPIDRGDTQMYKDDSWHVLEADSLVRSFQGPHPVLLFGFDVYAQPVDETLERLRRLNVDLSQVRSDEWEGSVTYVVGDESRQFWVDKQDLLLRRLIFVNPNTGSTREIRFEAYEPLGGGWIATELVFMRDGRVDVFEHYDYWTIDVQFEPSLFEVTADRTRPTWVKN